MYLMSIPKEGILPKDTEHRENRLLNAGLLIKEKKLATSVPQESWIYGNQNLVTSSKYNQ